jgi:hypothetical protein
MNAKCPCELPRPSKQSFSELKELFDSPADSIEEDEALEDALYGLQALENSLALDKDKQAA